MTAPQSYFLIYTTGVKHVMGIIKCKDCGHELKLDDEKCPRCGSQNRHVGIEEEIHFSDKINSFDEAAAKDLNEFFEKNSKKVFYSKQVEVIFEKKYYHWVTNRALRALDGTILRVFEKRLKFGGRAKFYFHNSNRYFKRSVDKAAKLIDEYSEANFVAGLGQTGELLVMEGFTRFGFSVLGRNTNELQGRRWTRTAHNLDFIFERDSIRYGVEVKNTLDYMDKEEFDIKIEICKELDVLPLFVNRMMPSTWMEELRENNGIWMIMGYQLYPIAHKTLADKVKKELELPVDAPMRLYDGTMERLMKQHMQKVGDLKNNSR